MAPQLIHTKFRGSSEIYAPFFDRLPARSGGAVGTNINYPITFINSTGWDVPEGVPKVRLRRDCSPMDACFEKTSTPLDDYTEVVVPSHSYSLPPGVHVSPGFLETLRDPNAEWVWFLFPIFIGRVGKGGKENHVNLGMYDRRVGELYRIEFHGADRGAKLYNAKELDTYLYEWAKSAGITYIRPSNSGWQARLDGIEDGLCGVWLMFYAGYLATHPEISYSQFMSGIDGLEFDRVEEVVSEWVKI